MQLKLCHNSKTQIVIVVIVAVMTVVVIVPLLVKTTWHLNNRCDILRAAFCDSRDAFVIQTCHDLRIFPLPSTWSSSILLSHSLPLKPILILCHPLVNMPGKKWEIKVIVLLFSNPGDQVLKSITTRHSCSGTK